jgi:hypothetical protein
VTQTPAPARSRSGGASLRARLFPGDGRLWLCAAAVIGVGSIVILVALLLPRDYYTGTNSVRTRGFPVEIHRGDRLCVPDVQVPAGTGRIQLEVQANGVPLAPMSGTLSSASGRRLADLSAPSAPPGRRKIDMTMPEQRSELAGTTLCLRSASPVFLGGLADIQGNDRPLTLNGKENRSRVAIWFRPPAGEKRSLLSHPGEILDRAALLRPGWVGPWTYWALLLVVMPLLGYAAVRLMASAGSVSRSVRRTALVVAALALLNAWTWALVTTPFNAPDESEHFAYVQYFAENGKTTQRQNAAPPLLPVYSTEETFALEAVRILSWNEATDGRPPWTEQADERWRKRVDDAPNLRRDNGGGPVPATWAHKPAYYASLAPAYLAGRGGSAWDELTLSRFLSGVYVAIAAACAFLLVRELLPRQPVLQVAAGVLVAFQPMFGFIGGAVNNDNGVNGAAAVVILLTVRALRRGLTVQSGIALGAALAVMPILKGTGYALWPLVALAGLALLVRRHSRTDLIGYGAAVGALAVVFGGWAVLSGLWDQPTTTADTGATASSTASGALGDPLGYLSYLWQVFLPPLPFMTDLFIFKWPFFNIYIERGWGAFGWYSVLFPKWVYSVILAVTVAVGALGVRAALRNRDWLRRNWLPVAFVVLVPVTVIAAVEAAYFAPTQRPVLSEFGRYLFPAITALAAIAVGACLGLGRRWAPVAAVGLASGVIVLDYASQLLSLAGSYT